MDPLRSLRAQVAALQGAAGGPDPDGGAGRFALGDVALDERLGGGLARGAVHETHAAADGDLASAAGFGLTLAIRAAPAGTLVWVRALSADLLGAPLHAPGVAELGLDPARLLLVGAQDGAELLRAADDIVRCRQVGALLVETGRRDAVLDLTASRRLALAAERSGVTVIALRGTATPEPSSARTRWTVRAAPSAALEADAPGHSAFDVDLSRHRGGLQGLGWRLEWDRDQKLFRIAAVPADARSARPDGAALPGAVLPLSPRRPAAAVAGVRRRA